MISSGGYHSRSTSTTRGPRSLKDCRLNVRKLCTQRVTARADDRAHCRSADEFAEAQLAEARGEHLRIRRRAPVLQDDLRAEEALEGSRRRLSPARLPDLILALDEYPQKLLLNVP